MAKRGLRWGRLGRGSHGLFMGDALVREVYRGIGFRGWVVGRVKGHHPILRAAKLRALELVGEAARSEAARHVQIAQEAARMRREMGDA